MIWTARSLPVVFAVALASCATTSGPRQIRIEAPAGKPVRVDGGFDRGEWSDARRLALPEGATLLVKRNSEALMIAVRLPADAWRYVDLYFADRNGRLFNFHASMQQGERRLPAGWSDSDPPFAWGPFEHWQSSIARRTGAPDDAPIARQIEPLAGYELRIPFGLLGERPVRMMVEIRDFMGEGPAWTFPTRAGRADPGTWILLG